MWPGCSRSKQPLVKTTRRPARFARPNCRTWRGLTTTTGCSAGPDKPAPIVQSPLVRIAISSAATQLSDLSEPYVACAPDTPEAQVAELFDKYNLITLAVVDEHGRIAGIITADDVIAMLRSR